MAAIAITRDEHDAAGLRRAASGSRDADAARRMLALALVLEGASRAAASTVSMRSCSTICDAGCSKRRPASQARWVLVQGFPSKRRPCRRRKAQLLLPGGASAGNRRAACPHQVADGLVAGVGYPDRRELAGTVQARQHHRVAPVRLDPIARLAGDLRWGGHDAFVSPNAQVPVDAVAAGAGLIAEPQLATACAELCNEPVEGRRVVRHLPEKANLPRASLLGERVGLVR